MFVFGHKKEFGDHELAVHWPLKRDRNFSFSRTLFFSPFNLSNKSWNVVDFTLVYYPFDYVYCSTSMKETRVIEDSSTRMQQVFTHLYEMCNGPHKTRSGYVLFIHLNVFTSARSRFDLFVLKQKNGCLGNVADLKTFPSQTTKGSFKKNRSSLRPAAFVWKKFTVLTLLNL